MSVNLLAIEKKLLKTPSRIISLNLAKDTDGPFREELRYDGQGDVSYVSGYEDDPETISRIPLYRASHSLRRKMVGYLPQILDLARQHPVQGEVGLNGFERVKKKLEKVTATADDERARKATQHDVSVLEEQTRLLLTDFEKGLQQRHSDVQFVFECRHFDYSADASRRVLWNKKASTKSPCLWYQEKNSGAGTNMLVQVTAASPKIQRLVLQNMRGILNAAAQAHKGDLDVWRKELRDAENAVQTMLYGLTAMPLSSSQAESI